MEMLIEDTIKNYEILTDNTVYFKEDELIITEGNSKVQIKLDN